MHSSEEDHLKLIESIVVEPNKEDEDKRDQTSDLCDGIEKFTETPEIVIFLVGKEEDSSEEGVGGEPVSVGSDGGL